MPDSDSTVSVLLSPEIPKHFGSAIPLTRDLRRSLSSQARILPLSFGRSEPRTELHVTDGGDYRQLMEICIKRLQNLTFAENNLKLNKTLCLALVLRVLEAWKVVEGRAADLLELTPILKQLYSVVKRVEILVEDCSNEQWLNGVVTLAETKEHFVEISFDLEWWTSVLQCVLLDDGRVLLPDPIPIQGDQGIFTKASACWEPTLFEEEACEDRRVLLSKLDNVIMKKDIFWVRRLFLEVKRGIWNPHDCSALATWLQTWISRRVPDSENLTTPDTESLTESLTVLDTKNLTVPTGEIMSRKRFSRSSSGKWICEKRPPQFKQRLFFDNMFGMGSLGVVTRVSWLDHIFALKLHHGAIPITNVLHHIEDTTFRHPNVLALLCLWMDTNQTSLLLEHMDGDLSNLINRRLETSGTGTPFTLLQAVDIMMQVARAMRYLHSRGVSHGDLKPLNILWKARNMDGPMGDGYVNVKVVDFGLAKLNEYKHQASIGSTTYRAPEVMEDGKTKPEEGFAPKAAADVYSFAIVCFEILTGKLPFADTEQEYGRRKMHDPEPGFLPQELCPKYLRSCLLKCWDLVTTRRPSFPQICEVLLHAQNYLLGLKHNVQCLSIG
ncbi:unnamed protein product [Sphagnum balticum]